MHLITMNTHTHYLPTGPGRPIRRTGQFSRCGRRAELGSTLIEALVAMLVLSVGMLGIAGLASASLRYSQGSWARAAVSSGLSDLADRIRSNPTAAVSDYAFNATDYADQREAFEDGDLAVARDCLALGCTPAQLAAYQLTDWRNALNRSMPGSAVWISGTRDTQYVATIMWFDKTFVEDDGVTPQASEECTVVAGVIDDEGILARTCCPAAAAVIDGVRCTNMSVIP